MTSYPSLLRRLSLFCLRRITDRPNRGRNRRNPKKRFSERTTPYKSRPGAAPQFGKMVPI
ncbi:hypothetical protein BOSE62_150434 [Bosea sp. 62]|nr:hypothetical protein BOSE46_10409 [Bosea sp. 46]CAD5250263.1 hypothetical protein BOSE21B_10622 [Bosea sp. 21B]CAD5265026.1 hypothetical protein BOSE7B_150515 [Bosea sp. 7B]VVT44373.1 hypothetical protein BOS5A_10450 [Bosea sp. EC-HK365B]VXB09491.1 hypothetical protein BOSE29B_10405 [Bosea sp. 29B]VXB83139.1 hypothetical protein BOSE62_150434 [Bosea sp. 62]VXC31688.1 hypothetical protein BOSE125_20088 [Bosea sp. 125]VXC45171.1 hypothetical protein BOSE127_190142 [Bosea sp. 127]